jgi:CheY-like chemotaxis protein
MRKVLIVEEDAFLVSIYSGMFERSGYGVTSVQNGEACLLALERERPHAIVLSLVFERMSGFSVLERLRTDPKMADIPAFVLTRLADPSDIRRCREFGCTGYFIKPHTRPEDVLRAVERAVLA